MDKNGGIEGIVELSFLALSLFGVQNGMLLEEVKAEHSALVCNAFRLLQRGWRLEQVVYFREVVKVKLLARMEDGIDVKQFLGQHHGGVARQESASEDCVRHRVVALQCVEYTLHLLQLLLGVDLPQVVTAQDALVAGTKKSAHSFLTILVFVLFSFSSGLIRQ